MVEVFKTNVEDDLVAREIVETLHLQFPDSEVNFDLEDCDHILRVESHINIFDRVVREIQARGFRCEVLTH